MARVEQSFETCLQVLAWSKPPIGRTYELVGAFQQGPDQAKVAAGDAMPSVATGPQMSDAWGLLLATLRSDNAVEALAERRRGPCAVSLHDVVRRLVIGPGVLVPVVAVAPDDLVVGDDSGAKTL